MIKTQKSSALWDAASQAFASMKAHCQNPSANAYAVWFAYHSKKLAKLREDIDVAIKQGKTIDDYFCNALYEAHIESAHVSEKIIKAGGSFEDKMDGVLRDIQDVREDANQFIEKLSDAKEKLVKNPQIDNVKIVVDDLTDATDLMVTSSAAITEKMAHSRDEITALKQQLAEARHEASKDALTGVANRKTFDSFMKEKLEYAKATREPFSIVMADIDFFKRINDRWGHQTGDQVICYVAGVLCEHAPKDGLVARMGGEEFAIIAPNTNVTQAREIAEKIRKQVEAKRLIRRNSKEDLGQITLSAGVAQYQNKEASSDLIERADKALYQSKNTGRNKTSAAPSAISRAA